MIRVKIDNIKDLKNVFDDDRKTFISSYLENSAVMMSLSLKNNNIIGNMLSDIGNKYKKINEGLTNIDNYWNNYIESMLKLENSLINGENDSSNPATSITLMGIEPLKDVEPIDNFVEEKEAKTEEKEGDSSLLETLNAGDTGTMPTYIDEEEYNRIKSEHILKSKEWCYYYAILEKYGFIQEGTTSEEIDSMINEVKTWDNNHGNNIIHSFPMVCHGFTTIYIDDTVYKGDYLKYYNEYGMEVVVPLATLEGVSKGDPLKYTELEGEKRDNYIKYMNKYYKDFMYNIEGYEEHYKNQVTSNLEKVVFIDLPDASNTTYEGAAAVTYSSTSGKSQIVFRTGFYNTATGEFSEIEYEYALATIDHEMAHSFDAAGYTTIGDCIVNSKEWKEVYKQVLKADPDNELLSKYAHSQPNEMFAEVMSEYYGGREGYDPDYNPNDLKMIKIDYDGYTNLYDLADDIAKGKYPPSAAIVTAGSRVIKSLA